MRCKILAALAVGVTLTLQAHFAHAQSTPRVCSAPEARWMDFWLGEWDVFNRATGAQAGVNSLKAMSRGCVIFESWESVGGFQGQSLNHYDAVTKTWRQNWLDQTGARLDFAGALDPGGALVLIAPGANASAKNRMTLTPQPDGSVRQHGESTTDGGETWKTDYDFIYRRRQAH